MIDGVSPLSPAAERMRRYRWRSGEPQYASQETDQIVAHIENKSTDTESAMTFKQGGFRQPPRQQAPHASFAEPGVHAGAAAELPP
jgi:hypothetical protein